MPTRCFQGSELNAPSKHLHGRGVRRSSRKRRAHRTVRTRKSHYRQRCRCRVGGLHRSPTGLYYTARTAHSVGSRFGCVLDAAVCRHALVLVVSASGFSGRGAMFQKSGTFLLHVLCAAGVLAMAQCAAYMQASHTPPCGLNAAVSFFRIGFSR